MPSRTRGPAETIGYELLLGTVPLSVLDADYDEGEAVIASATWQGTHLQHGCPINIMENIWDRNDSFRSQWIALRMANKADHKRGKIQTAIERSFDL